MENHVKLLNAAAFAAKKHRDQRRKGNDSAPYINHPLEVAKMLASVGGVDDADVLIAAILHDTIEDTETSEDEIRELFGDRVASIVVEVTDDKSLPKQARKEKQVEHAPHLSSEAKQLKICDKISNITDVLNNAPDGWSVERRIEYVKWGERVFAGLRGENQKLDDYFLKLAENAKKQLAEIV